MDRVIGYYVEQLKLGEAWVVKKPKSYSMMCISEGDKDVMILQMISGKLQVMAGTEERLMERLTDDQEKDNDFMDMLLLTFRSFMRPNTVFDRLVGRFNAELPPNPSPEDEEYFLKWKVPTQRRVMEIIRWWTEYHFNDFMGIP